ncbi:MAG: S-layer homology domain-containing protein, partial [Bacillota bacterium]
MRINIQFLRITASLLIIAVLSTAIIPGVKAVETYSGVLYCDLLYNSASYQDISGHWAQPAIYRVTALGIVRGEGSRFRPNSTASKEDVLGMLIRLAGMEQAAQSINVDPRNEAGHLNPWGANYVALAQAMGIITADEQRETNWRAGATREEVAYWMARTLNYLPVYGQAQQAIYGFNDWREFTKSRIPYCEAVIAARIMSGTTGNSFKPRQAITRAELAAVLDKACQVYLPAKGYKTLQGTIGNTSFVGGVPGAVRNHYQVVQDDGQSFFMIVDPERDFLVCKNKNLGKSGFLNTGDNVKVLVGPQNEILLVEATSGLQSMLEGVLDYLDIAGNKLYVTGWDGKNYIYPLSPLCKVNLSGYPARLNDLVSGQQVSLFLNGTQVSEIRSAVTYASSGALPRDANSAYGYLFRKSYDELSIRDDHDRPFTYSIANNARYYINGLSANYYDLKTGDYVKLTLDNNRKIVRVDVRRDDAGYKIYLARMYDVNSVFGEIRFDSVSSYLNGDMTAQGTDSLVLAAAQDIEAFVGNRKLSLLELEKYRGDYAYFVSARRGDEERVVKLVVRESTERKVSGDVQEVNATLNCLTVKYEPDRVYYDSGTIVIRDNRLIDGDAINSGDDIVVLAERESDNSIRARLIVVNSPEGESRYSLYRGYLREVLDRSQFEVGSTSRMEDNKWRGDYSYTEFYYDYRTRFLYADADGVERFGDSKFYNGDEDYEDLDVYVIAEGDKALAVIILDG